MAFEYEKYEMSNTGTQDLRDFRMTNNTGVLAELRAGILPIADRFSWAQSRSPPTSVSSPGAPPRDQLGRIDGPIRHHGDDETEADDVPVPVWNDEQRGAQGRDYRAGSLGGEWDRGCGGVDEDGIEGVKAAVVGGSLATKMGLEPQGLTDTFLFLSPLIFLLRFLSLFPSRHPPMDLALHT